MRIDNDRMMTNSFNDSIVDHTERGLLTEIPFRLRTHEESHDVDRKIEQNPFLPESRKRDERAEEMFDIQVCGLSQRLRFIGARHAVLGISGALTRRWHFWSPWLPSTHWAFPVRVSSL